MVVTCPCALSLATPVSITAATGTLTRNGLLTTRGHALEAMAHATHIVFDKTGTLTQGHLKLSGVHTFSGMEREQALALASLLESRSEHPVAKLLHHAATPPADRELKSVISTPGKGIEAVIDGNVYRIGSIAFVSELAGDLQSFNLHENVTSVGLCQGDQWLAVFELEDQIREQAPGVIRELQQAGLQVQLLSGDAREAVEHTAEQLGITDYFYSQSPENKLEHIRRLQADGAIVAMVGDGVNDAPVLSGADVSFAMGSGTQLAHASADMVLLSEQLNHLLSGLTMARRTMKIIRENLGWAVLYNLLALPLAASGMIAPWMAALGMSASSLVVVVNALRLRKH